MNININFTQFNDQFHKMGRGDNFSYEGLMLLFDYIEELNPDYSLDVTALCCEYSENSPSDIARDYSIEGDILSVLQDNTCVVGITSKGNIIYSNF